MIFLNNGKTIVVNAEEEPGKINDQQWSIADWGMDVDVQILYKTGFTSYDRMSRLTDIARSERQRKQAAKYRDLLGF